MICILLILLLKEPNEIVPMNSISEMVVEKEKEKMKKIPDI